MRDIAKSSVRTKRWTRLEYEREERRELIGGPPVVREPQGRPHVTGIRLVVAALRMAFGPG